MADSNSARKMIVLAKILQPVAKIDEALVARR